MSEEMMVPSQTRFYAYWDFHLGVPDWPYKKSGCTAGETIGRPCVKVMWRREKRLKHKYPAPASI